MDFKARVIQRGSVRFVELSEFLFCSNNNYLVAKTNLSAMYEKYAIAHAVSAISPISIGVLFSTPLK